MESISELILNEAEWDTMSPENKANFNPERYNNPRAHWDDKEKAAAKNAYKNALKRYAQNGQVPPKDLGHQISNSYRKAVNTNAVEREKASYHDANAKLMYRRIIKDKKGTEDAKESKQIAKDTMNSFKRKIKRNERKEKTAKHESALLDIEFK